MSIFSWISEMFGPISSTIDDLHFSGEEEAQARAKMAELKNKLAEIESKVATKTLELQSKLVEASAKVAMSEQQHGNFLSKSWRPFTSLMMAATLLGMGYGFVEFNPLLAQICGGFLGIYGIGRSYEKGKK